MEHGSKYSVAVVGGGPAGCMCAYFLQNDFQVYVFETASPLKTLLATGGGRCNLAYCEYDFKALAANYPRGEKFLYSVFSKFSTVDTLDFFHKIGVDTYIQDDMRIFPVSNSSKDVREKFLSTLNRVHFKNETVLRINKGKKHEVVTDCGSNEYDFVVIATGGHASYNICKYLGHHIIEPKPALVGLKTKEDLNELAGVCVKINGEDLLFTHNGISGPFAYKLSSIRAHDKFPYEIHLDFCGKIDLQKILNENSQKNIKNLMSQLIPKSLGEYILKHYGIDLDTKAHQINGEMRGKILNMLNDFKLTIQSTAPGSEVVSAGGVVLDEVDSRTMQSKLIQGIFFCGEVLDIDGFCGGFNLQNCWSTGAVAAQSIKNLASKMI